MKISRKRNGVWLAVCRECDNHKLHRSACNNGKSYRQCKKLKQYIKDVYFYIPTCKYVKFIENINPAEFRGEYVTQPHIRFVFAWRDVTKSEANVKVNDKYELDWQNDSCCFYREK